MKVPGKPVSDARQASLSLWDPLAAWPAGRWWLWGGVFVLTVLLQGTEFIQSLRPGPEEGIDFFQEWSSARNFFEGGDVYDNLPELADRFLGVKTDRTQPHVAVNAHPPAAVLLLMPLSLLDYSNACLAWNLLSLIALGISLRIVLHGLQIPFSPWAWFPLVTLLLLCNPLRQQTNQGQLSGLMSLLVTSIWISDRRGRPVWSGVWLGAATALKLFPGFLFLYFVLRRQWGTAAVGMVSFVALNTVTAAFLGTAAYVDYVVDVLPRVSTFRATWPNASLPGFVCRLFDDPAPALLCWHWRVVPLWSSPVVAGIGCLVAASVVTLLTARTILSGRSQWESDRAFGVTTTAMLLLSPITWDHYFLILIMPLILVWSWFPSQNSTRTWLLLTAAGLWLSPLAIGQTFVTAGDPPRDVFPMHVVTVLSFPCYALISLFCLGITARPAPPPSLAVVRSEPIFEPTPCSE